MKHLKYGIKYVETFPGTERTKVWGRIFFKKLLNNAGKKCPNMIKNPVLE